MSKRLLLTGCALGALTSLAVAQTATQPATPPAGSAPMTQPATPPAAGGAGQAAPSASGAAQPGVRTVNPTTVALTFYTVQPADMLASNLMGLDVHNLQNEEVGEIEDMIIDNGKAIRAVIVSVGGFLGIGERRVAVEPASVVITREGGAGNLKAVVNTTRENLKNAPEFKFENNMARAKR